MKTYYHQQVLKIKEAFYPKEYLCQQIIQAKKYIDANYAQAIDLQTTAAEAFLSVFHFIRLFKKIYGRTPHQYLIAVRIDRAKRMLQTDCSVSDVCFAVGFSSVTSFTRLFKRTTGLSPSVYQNNNMKNSSTQ